jgi:signal transduction histidine kinase
MGSHLTSFVSDHSGRLTGRTRSRDALTRLAKQLRTGELPLHEVVASLSSRLLDLPETNVGQGIDEALNALSVSLPADRVTLYLRAADSVSYVEVAKTSQIAGAGLYVGDPDGTSNESALEAFALADYPFIAAKMCKGEALELRSVDDLPGEATRERSLFRAPRTGSLLFVPMVSHRALVGFVAIEAPRRWAPEAPSLVRVVVDMLANLIERKRNHDRLQKIEDRLQKTQRLEIVGRFASGIAHDFNNYLTAILGYGELLSCELDADWRGQEEVNEIRNAAGRASLLVKQILGFSRPKKHDLKILGLNSALASLGNIVDRVAGDDVEVTYCFGTDLANARVDPVNFDQLVLNLVTNARDAMAHEGGRLTIATNSATCSSGAAVTLDVGSADGALDVEAPVGLASGNYVVMSVLDTGAGMTDETRVRLFEPFFTTKERGRGTGIGLSSVAGIVEASEGGIVVASELGVGSTFHMFFPVADKAEVSHERSAPQPPIMTSSGKNPVATRALGVWLDGARSHRHWRPRSPGERWQ